MSNELQVSDNKELSVDSVVKQFEVIDELYKRVLKVDIDYGKIPGTPKDTLLKPGAEKLNLLFKLVPKIEKEETADLGNGHREIKMIIGLYHKITGEFYGHGTGSCSTMETKFRYRNTTDYELTGEVIPKDAKDKKAEYRKQGYGMKKVNGSWEWVHYLSTEKVENADIADVYNTVRKICYKRALVSVTINATGVSNIFTQDVEDFTDNNYDDSEKAEQTIKKNFQPKEDDIISKLKSLPDEMQKKCKELKLSIKEVKELGIRAEWDLDKMWKELNGEKQENPFDDSAIPFTANDVSNQFSRTIKKEAKELQKDIPF